MGRQDDEQLKNVTGDWEGKKVEVEEATRRLAKSQDLPCALGMSARMQKPEQPANVMLVSTAAE